MSGSRQRAYWPVLKWIGRCWASVWDMDGLHRLKKRLVISQELDFWFSLILRRLEIGRSVFESVPGVPQYCVV